jgi:hypothetical protein
MEMTQPMQPLYLSANGNIRFRENVLVKYLIQHGNIDLDDLREVDCPQEDREQLAQLVGYSLDGYGKLSYVTDETYDVAHAMYHDGLDETTARLVVSIEHASESHKEVRKPIPVFGPLKLVKKENNETTDTTIAGR